MMAKRKRAPGGGRKRHGATVAQNLTIRIDSAMRGRLEFAALKRAEWKRNWNLSQEILMRLNQSLDREREGQRKPVVRAISFLITETAEMLSYDLRDPFSFQAFKLAVARVLDAIKPPGEVRRPEGAGPHMKAPGDVAALVARSVLHRLFTAEPPEAYEPKARQLVGSTVRDEEGRPLLDREGREMKYTEDTAEAVRLFDMGRKRDFYAMSDVRRDLGLDLDKGDES
jgi:hypothetical protein